MGSGRHGVALRPKTSVLSEPHGGEALGERGRPCDHGGRGWKMPTQPRDTAGTPRSGEGPEGLDSKENRSLGPATLCCGHRGTQTPWAGRSPTTSKLEHPRDQLNAPQAGADTGSTLASGWHREPNGHWWCRSSEKAGSAAPACRVCPGLRAPPLR